MAGDGGTIGPRAELSEKKPNLPGRNGDECRRGEVRASWRWEQRRSVCYLRCSPTCACRPSEDRDAGVGVRFLTAGRLRI